ncbi:hypothetical protein JCGZ_04825 [Jatropha curcas]|uniref:ENTH domain-containing protein n=1 Tax=Jatropha curcas TaxID=180498 RepID=A0A067KPX6_JATCU|nr:putative clathrin assembly protein At1g25240 [Jatropha curcas]KDP38182.1 hypothetical protein JCGZ_04825 [Jatropha curcas]
MKLWLRAAGALKDRTSLLVANLSPKGSYRNPDLETAIIKATSHNDSYVDYKNTQRVFAWVRASPVSMKPLIYALTTRMEKTQSWVVALKGLMLMHGVFCCKTQAVLRIGKLPFDLSNFTDGHSKPRKMWGFNTFIRCYYSFLDQRSMLLYHQRKQTEDSILQELIKLKNLQCLLDLLLQIKPLNKNMRQTLILDAMDCVIIEIFDIYSKICNGIAKILLSIYSVGKTEASMALRVLQKAVRQGEDLALYFDFCRDFGVFNAMEVPQVTNISEEDIRELERIINGFSDDTKEDVVISTIVEEDNKPNNLKTIITEKWEVFEDDLKIFNERNENIAETPFQKNCVPLDLVPVHKRHDIFPDLISF